MTWAGDKFEWDEDKALKNLRNHGVPFSDVTRFEHETAMYIRDDRRDYGEVRLIAIGFIDVRVCVCLFIQFEMTQSALFHCARQTKGRLVLMNNFSKTDALKRARAARQAMSDAEDIAITKGAKADADNPPLTEALLKRGRGRPPLAPEARKQKVNIMLDPDIVAHFKSGGKGWQTRINASLRDVVKRAERKSG